MSREERDKDRGEAVRIGEALSTMALLHGSPVPVKPDPSTLTPLDALIDEAEAQLAQLNKEADNVSENIGYHERQLVTVTTKLEEARVRYDMLTKKRTEWRDMFTKLKLMKENGGETL